MVPQRYLKGWCDPNPPPGYENPKYEPTVWLISKDGTSKKRKAPKNTFAEADFYTIKLPDGSRDLVADDTLGELENRFPALVEKLTHNLELDCADREFLSDFAASMLARTKPQKLNLENSLDELLSMAKSMEQQFGVPPFTSSEIETTREHASAVLGG